MTGLRRISGLAEGRAALHGDASAVLALPADAGGAAWAAEVARTLRAEFPGAAIVADCGASAGAAMAALREGMTEIGFDGPPEIAAKIEAMGAKVRRG
jgi:Flp pilus assembly CpaE family ATPase